MSQAIATLDSITLPGLVDRASSALAGARTAAEVLEARDMASFAYDAAKKAARLLRAKKAHDELVGAAYRAQADATEIEARAKRRIADEYDAAQERGEVADQGKPSQREGLATVSEIGLSHKDIHEARIIRDAEDADPGVVRRALDEAVDAGEEPTKAVVMRAVLKASARKSRPRGPRFEVPEESQHDRDLRMLLGVWEVACDSARAEFLSTVNQG
jgi:hypothetical protein